MIGIDIVKISRIDALLKNDKFLKRIFNRLEIEQLGTQINNEQRIAGSFAAKEAVSKVFGTGIGKLSFKDIIILRDQKGKPYCVLSEKGRQIADKYGLMDFEISISHEKEYAVAIAKAKSILPPFCNFDTGPNLPVLFSRPMESHKGSYGKIGIIGASKGMLGSVILSSYAALRTGSGIVYTIVPESISDIAQIKSVENIVKSAPDNGLGHFTYSSTTELKNMVNEFDAYAFGPGIGRSEDIPKILSGILREDVSIIVDADGLYALSGKLDILRGYNACITPHPLEMARLIEKDVEYVQENRLDVAMSISKLYNIIVVLKGHETIVTNGDAYYINKTGNSGMATAGSGDVLTGAITSLAGMGYKLYDAAVLGVYLHGLAGDCAAYELGEDSVIASDIIDSLSSAIKYKRIIDARNNYKTDLGGD